VLLASGNAPMPIARLPFRSPTQFFTRCPFFLFRTASVICSGQRQGSDTPPLPQSGRLWISVFDICSRSCHSAEQPPLFTSLFLLVCLQFPKKKQILDFHGLVRIPGVPSFHLFGSRLYVSKIRPPNLLCRLRQSATRRRLPPSVLDGHLLRSNRLKFVFLRNSRFLLRHPKPRYKFTIAEPLFPLTRPPCRRLE